MLCQFSVNNLLIRGELVVILFKLINFRRNITNRTLKKCSVLPVKSKAPDVDIILKRPQMYYLEPN